MKTHVGQVTDLPSQLSASRQAKPPVPQATSPIRTWQVGDLAHVVLLVLIVGFAAGVMYLFGVQFAAGDVYPEYSSLRSDPMGTKLLFESLTRLSGVTVARNYLPLDVLGENGAVFLIGLNPGSFGEDDEGLQHIERLARSGHRVVAALSPPSEYKDLMALALDRAWHVKLGADSNHKHVHRLYFSEAKDWNVLDRVGPKLLAIDRDFGKGSIVLFAESDDFANQATVAADRLEMVSMAIGANSHVVFDEQHLGITETGSFVGLARRFRLTGLALGLAICAALFLWRSASGFPPPASGQDVPLSGRTSLAGLLTLLRRHIHTDELAATCWQEWLSANRWKVAPERLEQAARIRRKPVALPAGGGSGIARCVVRRAGPRPAQSKVAQPTDWAGR